MLKMSLLTFSPLALAVMMLSQPVMADTKSEQHAPNPVIVASSTVMQELDNIASRYYPGHQPGATIIVMKDGKTLLRKGYGLANLEKAEKLQADHVMRLGSITKQFTAVAILQLVEAGKIGLNDPITRFFPDFPDSAKQITVEHLLTHTSGIPSYTGKPGFMESAGKDISVQAMLDSFKNDALEFEPGTAWKYNNSGYFLLGALIEKVSGENYANYVAKHLFEPLGMKHTAYENVERHPQMKALGYSKRSENFEPSIKISMTQPYAAGSLCSNVDDLATWDAAIRAGKLLKADTWKRAFTSYKLKNGQDTSYAYGWGVGKLDGQSMLSHGGGIPGFSTFALSLPQSHLYVAVLTNADGGLVQPEVVATRLAASAIGKPIPDFKAIQLDERALDRFVGVYRIDDQNRRYVMREGNQLVMTRTNGPRTVMQAYSANGFFKDNESLLRVEFTLNPQGEVSSVTVYQNGTSTVHPKLNESLPQAPKTFDMSAEQFAAFEGDYQIQANFILNVRREGTRYVTQATGQGPVGIIAVSADTFSAPDVGAQLKFEKDVDGKVTQLILTQGGRAIPAKKVK